MIKGNLVEGHFRKIKDLNIIGQIPRSWKPFEDCTLPIGTQDFNGSAMSLRQLVEIYNILGIHINVIADYAYSTLAQATAALTALPLQNNKTVYVAETAALYVVDLNQLVEADYQVIVDEEIIQNLNMFESELNQIVGDFDVYALNVATAEGWTDTRIIQTDRPNLVSNFSGWAMTSGTTFTAISYARGAYLETLNTGTFLAQSPAIPVIAGQKYILSYDSNRNCQSGSIFCRLDYYNPTGGLIDTSSNAGPNLHFKPRTINHSFQSGYVFNTTDHVIPAGCTSVRVVFRLLDIVNPTRNAQGIANAISHLKLELVQNLSPAVNLWTQFTAGTTFSVTGPASEPVLETRSDGTGGAFSDAFPVISGESYLFSYESNRNCTSGTIYGELIFLDQNLALIGTSAGFKDPSLANFKPRTTNHGFIGSRPDNTTQHLIPANCKFMQIKFQIVDVQGGNVSTGQPNAIRFVRFDLLKDLKRTIFTQWFNTQNRVNQHYLAINLSKTQEYLAEELTSYNSMLADINTGYQNLITSYNNLVTTVAFSGAQNFVKDVNLPIYPNQTIPVTANTTLEAESILTRAFLDKLDKDYFYDFTDNSKVALKFNDLGDAPVRASTVTGNFVAWARMLSDNNPVKMQLAIQAANTSASGSFYLVLYTRKPNGTLGFTNAIYRTCVVRRKTTTSSIFNNQTTSLGVQLAFDRPAGTNNNLSGNINAFVLDRHVFLTGQLVDTKNNVNLVDHDVLSLWATVQIPVGESLAGFMFGQSAGTAGIVSGNSDDESSGTFYAVNESNFGFGKLLG